MEISSYCAFNWLKKKTTSIPVSHQLARVHVRWMAEALITRQQQFANSRVKDSQGKTGAAPPPAPIHHCSTQPRCVSVCMFRPLFLFCIIVFFSELSHLVFILFYFILLVCVLFSLHLLGPPVICFCANRSEQMRKGSSRMCSTSLTTYLQLSPHSVFYRFVFASGFLCFLK